MIGTAGAAPSNGAQVGSAVPSETFTANTPFSSGQILTVNIPANTVLPGDTNVLIEECAAPNGVIPTQSTACDSNTVDSDTITPNSNGPGDGSFTYSTYTAYALPDTHIGDPVSSNIHCGNTAATECILYVGDNVNDFTQPHFWSQAFYINPTANDSGANPGDGSAPSVATTPSPTLSTVASSSATAVANGVDSSTVTVTLNGTNSQSATVPIAGATVTLSQGSGSSTITPTSATTDSSGVATFTVKDNTVQSVTYTASSGSVTVTQTAAVEFVARSVSTANSTVVSAPTSVPADGTSTATITVTVRDQGVSPQPIIGATVTLAQGSGHSIISPSSATTGSSGVATFTATDVHTEPVTYTATAGGVVLTQTASVTFGSLTVSPTDSTVVAASSTAPTGSSGGTTVTVTLLTSVPNGSHPVAGKNVVLAVSGPGSAVVTPSSPQMTGANGAAIFTVTDTSIESVVFSATDQSDTLAIGQTASVQFQAPTVSSTLSTISAVSSTPPSLTSPADGTTPFNVFVVILNSSGQPVPGDVVNLAPTTTDVKVDVTPDAPQGTSVFGATDANGQAEFQVLDTVAESVPLTAVDTTANVTLTAHVTLTFVAGPVDGFQSTVAATPGNVAADGATSSTVKVTLQDHFGNPVSGKTVSLDQGSGHSVISPPTAVSSMSGVAVFTVTDTSNENVVYAATDVNDGLIITQTAPVTFGTPPPTIPLAGSSVIVSNYSVVPADGKTAATVTALLYDSSGLPVGGRSVTIKVSGGSSTIAPTSQVSDPNGAAAFQVTDTVPETVTYTAVDTSDNLTVSGSVVITFKAPSTASDGTSTAQVRLNQQVVGMATTPDGGGYWLAAADGGVFTYGDATFNGSGASLHLNSPVVGIARTPDGGGYWLVAADGGVFRFGDARFFGSAGNLRLNEPIVGMAATPDGGGYWLVASDGGIFGFGDAAFHGSAGDMKLNSPVVGMAATSDGGGYWLVASDGGVFCYGDAEFYGSTGAIRLNRPVVGMAATADGSGYWLVASDGGIFRFGAAGFHGSTGGMHLNAPVVGMAATPDGAGYWLAASDGGIFSGDAHFYGSAA